jgi:hypothetical protein
VGIRLRRPDGSKREVKGGEKRRFLCYPSGGQGSAWVDEAMAAAVVR